MMQAISLQTSWLLTALRRQRRCTLPQARTMTRSSSLVCTYSLWTLLSSNLAVAGWPDVRFDHSSTPDRYQTGTTDQGKSPPESIHGTIRTWTHNERLSTRLVSSPQLVVVVVVDVLRVGLRPSSRGRRSYSDARRCCADDDRAAVAAAAACGRIIFRLYR